MCLTHILESTRFKKKYEKRPWISLEKIKNTFFQLNKIKKIINKQEFLEISQIVGPTSPTKFFFLLNQVAYFRL
jgi:hypothetical protein